MNNNSTQDTAHRALGLTDCEYELILKKLGRSPNRVELAIFSLMWSEHCGYKHSRKLLKRLPTEGPRVIVGPGENAGAVDVGDGLAVAFKVESHNHPSAVEPFQGAATGAGGILRDIFALGARPIALLDSLRFGELDTPRSRYLLDRVVAGIGHYGNSIGVPTVGGEIYFEGPYEQNCLVNVMCVGLVEHDKLIRSAAAGVGNTIVLFGALTGRDGIGGASVLASAEFDTSDQSKRPSVQIGDPFEEKKLLECSLDLLDRGLLVALQDLGAAGLTSSASEMAAKGEVGIDIDVQAVPLREQDMEPFEIMISESQERMLAVIEPAQVEEVLAVCAHWDIEASAIGKVTDTRELRVLEGKEVIGEIPVNVLVDDCPAYDLTVSEPEQSLYPNPQPASAKEIAQSALGLKLSGESNRVWQPTASKVDNSDFSKTGLTVFADGRVLAEPILRIQIADDPSQKLELPLTQLTELNSTSNPSPHAEGLGEILCALLTSANLVSRAAIYDRYDQLVQSRTILRPGEGDAAILLLPNGKAIAVAIDGNGRRVACDPYRGAVEQVYECAANLACVGAEPLGVTNCLNFGNPEKSHIAWQLEQAVQGITDACNALKVPVVGGNVSLYNEGPEGPIYPTPVIGMVGEIPDPNNVGQLAFSNPGDTIQIVGPFNPSLVGSELSKLRGESLQGQLPVIDQSTLCETHALIRKGIRAGALNSAHDIADGGLAVAIAECCLASGLGAELQVHGPTNDLQTALFGEGAGGFIVAGNLSD